MEYYNEFKLTMETNAKAKEASEILINRLNKGFEIDNTYRFNPSSKMAQVISANDNTVTLDGCNGVQREHNKKLNNGLPIYTKYRPNETTGGIFVSWRRKEELPTGA